MRILLFLILSLAIGYVNGFGECCTKYFDNFGDYHEQFWCENYCCEKELLNIRIMQRNDHVCCENVARQVTADLRDAKCSLWWKNNTFGNQLLPSSKENSDEGNSLMPRLSSWAPALIAVAGVGIIAGAGFLAFKLLSKGGSKVAPTNTPRTVQPTTTNVVNNAPPAGSNGNIPAPPQYTPAGHTAPPPGPIFNNTPAVDSQFQGNTQTRNPQFRSHTPGPSSMTPHPPPVPPSDPNPAVQPLQGNRNTVLPPLAGSGPGPAPIPGPAQPIAQGYPMEQPGTSQLPPSYDQSMAQYHNLPEKKGPW